MVMNTDLHTSGKTMEYNAKLASIRDGMYRTGWAIFIVWNEKPDFW